MNVYFEDIDGELQAKWVIVEAGVAEGESNTLYYSTDQPIERFYPEDFHDDFSALSVSLSELVQDPFEDNSFGINTDLIQGRLKQHKLDPDNLYEVDYFILLCDDLEEFAEIELPTLP
ncbi:hypothetical protein [Salibacterium qingdaonense]|uniref:Uncharacterized protein n=1 Tax=Salibacterium qingdaonense TaxID=266892 RepID=A0A1I4QVX5_9BACI|nr:hypothetical protein [Salibacterium qingdaonense]SFM43955.1 hypothetical protein SAMN04488054_1513 [Salibacterium qingdaonense]